MEKSNNHDKHGLILKDLKTSFRRLRLLFKLCLIGAFLLWLVSGFYVVRSNEQGVVSRFGKVLREAVSPGMHYHVPWPVEKVDRPRIKDVRRVHVGYMAKTEKAEEGIVQRLTGDINIINLSLMLQYSIKDAADYLFRTENPDELIRVVAEAVINQVVGGMSVDDILTVGKLKIQDRTQRLTQEVLDKYGCGIYILNANLQENSPPKDVIESFKDIINAQADMDRYLNQARAYRSTILPKARGEAETMLRLAEGYRENVTNRALGETERFLKILEEYQKAPQVNRDRLYLETMEKIGPKIKKCIIPGALDQNLTKIYGIGLSEPKDSVKEVIIRPWDDYDTD